VILRPAPDDGDAAFIDGDTTGSELEPDIPFLGLAFTSPIARASPALQPVLTVRCCCSARQAFRRVR
jgi:hypothetical protein